MSAFPRAGLYVLTPPHAGAAHELADRVGAAIEGGARVVQYRDKTDDHARRLAVARAIAATSAARGAAFIVNDDVELARAAGADGVHVGLSDASVRAAREALGDRAIVGATCHDSLALAIAAERDGADYVAFGSFFTSPTKPNASGAPVQLLEQARERLGVPIVAIGGITLDRAPRLLAAGADLLAVVSGVFGAADVRGAAHGFAELFGAAQPARPRSAQLETEHR